jgi:hypothetical protein
VAPPEQIGRAVFVQVVPIETTKLENEIDELTLTKAKRAEICHVTVPDVSPMVPVKELILIVNPGSGVNDPDEEPTVKDQLLELV